MKNMEIKNNTIEEFKKQLEKLLLKFPNLPEFNLTVRPRVSIDVAKPEEAKKTYPPSKVEVPTPVSNPNIVIPSKDPIDVGLAMEKGITPGLMANLTKFTQIE